MYIKDRIRILKLFYKSIGGLKMSYKRCIEIVCTKVVKGIKVDDDFIEYITSLIEDNLNEKVVFEINPDEELEEYMKYPVFAFG